MYNFIKNVVVLYMKVFMKISVQGKENIPQSGGAILCANHVHLLDPFSVGMNTKRVVNFMAKKDLFKGWFGQWFFSRLHAIPVNRDGNDAYSLKRALKVIDSQELLGIFPEGTREKGEVLSFKPGVSMLSVRTKTPLIPIYIEGNYKIFSKLNVIIGKPIDLSEYYGKKLSVADYEYIANEIIEKNIMSLKVSSN